MAAPVVAKLLSHRIVQAPKLACDDPDRAVAAGRARMLPAIAAAHAAGRAVVCCWMRTRPHGRVSVLAGDLTTIAPAEAAVPLPFPAGSRGVSVHPEQLTMAMRRLPCWRQGEVALDCLDWPPDGPSSAGPTVDELFSLTPHWATAVLVAAEPVDEATMAQRLRELSDLVGRLEARRAGRGDERIRFIRAESELAYLERCHALGLWEVRVWTAGTTPESCDAMVALLGGSSDLTGVPLRVRPQPRRPAPPVESPPSSLAWGQRCLAGPDAVTAIARPPTRELPGIRIVAMPEFDLTPEVAAELRLGAVLDATRTPTIPFGLPRDSVNRHVLVTGATGSGKSQTVRTLLEQLTAARVPWLVIEPAKAEYGAMAGRLGGSSPVLVIRPGQPDVAPASLNPLEPGSITVSGRTVRFPLQTHADLVRALFTASFEAQEPFPQILAGALTRCYQDLGWNLTVGRALHGGDHEPRWPTLADLQRQALAAIDDVGYGNEVRQNMRGFVRVRIDSLRLGTPGRFFHGGHPLDLERLLGQQVVFEIEDLGDDNDKAFFIGCVLVRLFEVMRLRERHGVLAKGLAHVTVIEEAHRLLRHAVDGSAAAQAVTMFANLLAEIRAYGEGIVVAEQIPAKLIPDVVKNSAVKVMHRLPAQDDRDFVGATMNLGALQSEQVVSLEPGVAVAHVDGMDRPVLLAVDSAAMARESRAGAVTNAPVRPRDAGCPRSCRMRPCTLEEIVRSETLPPMPRIRLWAEVVVIAHLTGDPAGRPGAQFSAELGAIDPGRAHCAIGLAVADAVARRDRAIRRWYLPDELTSHVSGLLRRQLAGGSATGESGLRWRVAQFRWAVVLRALLTEPSAGGDPARPHPDTALWARHDLPVPGSDWAQQLAAAHARALAAEVPAQELIDGDPPVVEQLAGADPGRLADAVRALGLDPAWLLLRMRDPRESSP